MTHGSSGQSFPEVAIPVGRSSTLHLAPQRVEWNRIRDKLQGKRYRITGQLHLLAYSLYDTMTIWQYIGGVFGMLAFIGVLYTVGLQRPPLDQFRQQATVDALERNCRALASRVDAVLDYTISVLSAATSALRDGNLPKTMRGVLELAADEENPPDDAQHASFFIAQHQPTVSKDALVLGLELDQLAEGLVGTRTGPEWTRFRSRA